MASYFHARRPTQAPWLLCSRVDCSGTSVEPGKPYCFAHMPSEYRQAFVRYQAELQRVNRVYSNRHANGHATYGDYSGVRAVDVIQYPEGSYCTVDGRFISFRYPGDGL